ncbi:hypothetical protein PSTT_07066 [Puccinia striiformis]|uniref:Uncharacterized protein n=1 Tax=Puccinia striiformis TaxID=27350 RepID=A0A2S4VI51_9BASI|nr:hypothetical protein PSTT_07066 [Puccinia striiformis]
MAEQGCPFGPPSIALATSRPHQTFGDPRVTPTGFELAELSTKSEEQPNRRQGIHTHTTSSSSSQASSTHLFAMGLATYTATWAAIGFGFDVISWASCRDLCLLTFGLMESLRVYSAHLDTISITSRFDNVS